MTTDAIFRIYSTTKPFTSVSAIQGDRPLASPRDGGRLHLGRCGRPYMWVDPKERMFVVFMMQSPKQRLYRRSLLKDMVYSAVDRSHGPAAQN
jgi:CubicO group peptidase (beta-lactamase class C family)